MNIIEATKALQAGKAVRRKEWHGGLAIHGIHSAYYGNNLDEDQTPYRWHNEDIIANDWEVIEEKSPMEKAWHEYHKDSLEIWTSEKKHFVAGWNAGRENLKDQLPRYVEMADGDLMINEK